MLELAVGRQVAREQDRVDLAFDAGEGALDLVAVDLVAVHVARRGHADRPGHGAGFNRLEPARDGYTPAPWPSTATNFEQLLDTLKRAGAALRDAEIPFALGGGMAIWAHGGPETEHDLDFFVKPEDAERALQALAEIGFRPEKPPEGWLYKAWDGDVLVDLIFEPAGMRVDDKLFRRRASSR